MLARLGSVLAWLEVQSNRAKLYRLASVLGPLLIAAGLLSDDELGSVLAILGALTGFGGNRLADKHSRERTPRNARGAAQLVEVLLVLILLGVAFLVLDGVRFH
jgi:hypothetical protein